MAETKLASLVYELAAWLHRRNHKSTRSVMCRSDMDLAQEIIAWIEAQIQP